LASFYQERRDYLLTVLNDVGFECYKPGGAYYIMADIRPLGWSDDVEFAFHLAKEIGVAVVPGSSFYCPDNPEGKTIVRFCFCKQLSTLETAAQRLKKIKMHR